MAASSVMIVKCDDPDETIALRSEINPEQWSKEILRHSEEVTVLGTAKGPSDSGMQLVDYVKVRSFSGAEGWVKAKFLQPAVSKMIVKCLDVPPRFDEAKVLRAQLNPDLWLQEAVRDGEVVTAVSIATAPGYLGKLEEFVLVRTATGVEGWLKKMFLQPVGHPISVPVKPGAAAAAAAAAPEKPGAAAAAAVSAAAAPPRGVRKGAVGGA
eukprot:TRINITY_DN12975_c0_g4_i6.p1 TRINITY_DN12975_c0_g4~~TRINITY_DN12975_c0_g4_i6.p1  ORF type:complete len:243 (-),score=68.56 TRINITY_DN12975_c0_g4_i6:506-1138(-)